MKLTVGLTKKIGQPGYGSVGASCQLESSEFAADLAGEEFARRVEAAFNACRTAVEAELRKHLHSSQAVAHEQSRPSDRNGSMPLNGHSEHRSGTNGTGGRPATEKQIKALRAMVARCSLPNEELDRIFAGKSLARLSIAEASAAIDRIKIGAPSPDRRSRNSFHEGDS